MMLPPFLFSIPQERYRLVQAAVLINRAIGEVPEGIERYVLTKKYLLGWGWERTFDTGHQLRNRIT